MLSWPIIYREMLLEARRPGNYRMRVAAGTLAFLFLGVAAALQTTHSRQSGHELFMVLHACVLLAILGLCPILASDSLSREAREGTLGLLLLTPLTARQIVGGKFVVHLLSLLTIWGLSIPFLIVPLLIGGVGWQEILISCLIQLFAGVVSLSASMYASSRSKKWLSSLVLAGMLSLFTVYLTYVVSLLALALFSTQQAIDISVGYWILGAAIEMAQLQEEIWNVFLREILSRGKEFQGCLAAVSVLLFLQIALPILFLLRASGRISRFAETEFESRRSRLFRNVFLTPRFWKGNFRKAMSRRLDRNPLIWLEYRSAWSRSFRWMLVLSVVGIYAMAAASSNWSNYLIIQLSLWFALLLIMAFTSSISFQKERESGAFELLLVAPFRIKDLILGRLSAVWGYYRPVAVSIIALGIVPLFLGLADRVFEDDNAAMALLTISLVCSYLSIPIAGLLFALRMKNFFSVFILTVLISLIVPAVFHDLIRSGRILVADHPLDHPILLSLLTPTPNNEANLIIAWHVAVCLWGLLLLHDSLVQRKIITTR